MMREIDQLFMHVLGICATLLSELAPPSVGGESRIQLGWEAENSSERAVYLQCFQTGDVKVAHKKGVDNATLSVEFGMEFPAVGQPFRRFFAGTAPIGTA